MSVSVKFVLKWILIQCQKLKNQSSNNGYQNYQDKCQRQPMRTQSGNKQTAQVQSNTCDQMAFGIRKQIGLIERMVGVLWINHFSK